MVGIGLLSALFRCQDPAHATNTPGSGSRSCVRAARKTPQHATGKANDLASRASTDRWWGARRACPCSEVCLQCSRYRGGMDLDAMRSVARSAALVGASAVRDGVRPEVGAAKGLPGDWVTEVDLASERAIASFLASETPRVPFVGEELGGAADSRLRWVVDPLDGTTNYVHGFWAVGVSVALVDGDRPVAGAVAAPFLGEIWHAAAGGGAVWERAGGSEPCRVSSRAPASAVVATGFPFRRKERLPRYLASMNAALEAFEDLRRPGAASLDLAWTACGVFDGFFELGLAAWDVAAGGLLVQEAGGAVSDWNGGDGWLGGDILAGSAAVHGALQSRVGAAGTGSPHAG